MGNRRPFIFIHRIIRMMNEFAWIWIHGVSIYTCKRLVIKLFKTKITLSTMNDDFIATSVVRTGNFSF